VTEARDKAGDGADLVIQNGFVIDGTGAPPRASDIAIRGDRIAAVAAPGTIEADGATVIDATRRTVAPGFIDSHTHDDNAVLTTPDMVPKLSQGVTTVIVGNCGISLSPLDGRRYESMMPPLNLLGDNASYLYDSMAGYTEAVDTVRPRVNVAALVGHMTLRVGVMDDLDRRATAAEIGQMQERLRAGLDAGAIGFSTGLFYKPNAAADTDEVVEVASVLAAAGGIYVTHMRDEHARVTQSLEETFEIGQRAKVPVVISHHKCAGPLNWGRSRETLPMIDAARTRQAVGLDAYPYAAGSTVLDPDLVDDEIRIMVNWSIPHPQLAGLDLSVIAKLWACGSREAARRLSPAGAIYFQIDEADVRRILTYPPTMIGSDGLPHDTHPHPRLWGTFPRVLGHYSRDLGLFPLEQAVHKMTGLTAATFGLTDRGELRAGAYADLVLFDPAKVIDRATFDEPCRPAHGIDLVMVNGEIAWRDGAISGERSGRFVKRGAALDR